jgi:DNA-binding phage protein
MSETFGPRNEAESRTFTIEGLRVDFQQAFYAAMRGAGVDERELARRLDISVEAVHELFATNANPSLVFIGKVFHALGCRCVFRLERVSR